MMPPPCRHAADGDTILFARLYALPTRQYATTLLLSMLDTPATTILYMICLRFVFLRCHAITVTLFRICHYYDIFYATLRHDATLRCVFAYAIIATVTTLFLRYAMLSLLDTLFSIIATLIFILRYAIFFAAFSAINIILSTNRRRQ